LIHRLTYARTNKSLHVRGYKEKGNINTPMELAMNNETDRFSLAIDAIDRVPKLQKIGGHAKEKFRNEQIACRAYAYEHGVDRPEILGWRWPLHPA
jgi:xylulose-5-phosphate/fructose-6-phosphate phosphoketolase